MTAAGVGIAPAAASESARNEESVAAAVATEGPMKSPAKTPVESEATEVNLADLSSGTVR